MTARLAGHQAGKPSTNETVASTAWVNFEVSGMTTTVLKIERSSLWKMMPGLRPACSWSSLFSLPRSSNQTSPRRAGIFTAHLHGPASQHNREDLLRPGVRPHRHSRLVVQQPHRISDQGVRPGFRTRFDTRHPGVLTKDSACGVRDTNHSSDSIQSVQGRVLTDPAWTARTNQPF